MVDSADAWPQASDQCATLKRRKRSLTLRTLVSRFACVEAVLIIGYEVDVLLVCNPIVPDEI